MARVGAARAGRRLGAVATLVVVLVIKTAWAASPAATAVNWTLWAPVLGVQPKSDAKAGDGDKPVVDAVHARRRLLPDSQCFPGSFCTHRSQFAEFEFCFDLDWEACPRAILALDAEANALEVYNQLLPFLDPNPDCLNAARHFICASWFPRCTREEVDFPGVTVRDVCKSTCENYFKACKMNVGTACDGFIGTGPNNGVCTGAAMPLHGHHAIAAALLAAVGVAALLMM